MTTYAEGKFVIFITQGDDWSAPMIISTQLGNATPVPVDLSSATILFVVRDTYNTGNVVSATITPVDIVNGEFIVSLTDTQTNGLPAGSLKYQMTTTVAGITTTRGYGSFVVRPRIQPA